MKTKTAISFLICVIFLSACGGVTPYPIPSVASPNFALPTAIPLPTITETITITPTPENTPTPETLYGYPTPEIAVRATCVPHMDCWQLTPNVQRQDFTFHELYLGKYVLRNWCNIDPHFSFLKPCAVTISSKGSKQIEIWGYPAKFGQETGADLTGRGKPDIVVIGWSDGNCCVSTTVYEAGDDLNKIMDVGSHWLGNFTDLNKDGTYEYIVMDRLWSGFCNYCAVWTTFVYEYQPDKLRYVPETSKFKEVLSADINDALDFISQYTKNHPNIPLVFATDADSENKYWQYATGDSDYQGAVNAIYRLAIYYLLAGQPTDAQNMLNKYFPPDKAVEYMLGIQKDLQGFHAP